MEMHLKFKWLWCWFYLLSRWTQIQCLHAGESCMAENVEGICKQIIDCPLLKNEVSKFGSPVPDHIKKRLQAFLCGFENGSPIICCTSQINLSLTQQSIAQDTRGLPDVSKHRNIHLLPMNCGFAAYDRIFHGPVTQMYEMPWLALLAYNSSNGVKLSCSGSIINDRYVLTAAHCVSLSNTKLKLAHVILGEYDLSTDPDCQDDGGSIECAPNILNVTISEVTVHPDFSPKNMLNDIALLRLSQKIDLSSAALKSICLPIERNIQLKDLDGKWGQIAGWNSTEARQQTSKLLNEDIRFLKKEECERAYKVNITERQICGTSSCISNYGGPLIDISESDRGYQKTQRGIVSFRPKYCGFGETPGVYTNVAYYVDWILDNIY